jgi:hypothetical protein
VKGGTTCRFHGGQAGRIYSFAKWRLEIARGLAEGTPHPASIFFELLRMKWRLSADGSELTCSVPTAQLGNVDDVRAGLGWVNHWTTVMNHREYREAETRRKKLMQEDEFSPEERARAKAREWARRRREAAASEEAAKVDVVEGEEVAEVAEVAEGGVVGAEAVDRAK